ncbi:MAG TPA: hypothetical protein VIH57_22610, partial [Bacteroidales bacterium]
MALKGKILVFISVILISGNLFAQSKLIDLWNGKVPGAIHNDKFKQMVDTSAGWIDKHSVVNPDLYFYP